MLERIAAPNEHLHLEAEQCIELRVRASLVFFAPFFRACTLLSMGRPLNPRRLDQS